MTTNGSDFQFALDCIVSFDEAVSLGADCIEQHALSNWQLGDLAARVACLRPDDPLVAEKAETLRKFAAAVRQKYSHVRTLAQVASVVPPEYRSPALSFSHYRILVLAGMTREQVFAWAARAEDAGWNAQALAREVTKVRGGTARGSKDRQAKDALEYLERGANLARGVTMDGALAVAREHPEEINRALSAMAYAARIFSDAQDRVSRERQRRKTVRPLGHAE